MYMQILPNPKRSKLQNTPGPGCLDGRPSAHAHCCFSLWAPLSAALEAPSSGAQSGSIEWYANAESGGGTHSAPSPPSLFAF